MDISFHKSFENHEEMLELAIIIFANKPSGFKKLVAEVQKHNKSLIPVYGLENAGNYGRNLAIYLLEKKQIVKDVILHYPTHNG